MKREVPAGADPTKGLWERFLVLIPLLIVLVLASRTYIRSVGGTYVIFGAYIRLAPATFVTDGTASAEGEELSISDVRLSDPSVVEATSIRVTEYGRVSITLKALADGEATVEFGDDGAMDFEIWNVRVVDGVILESGVDFSGWESIGVSLCVFFAVTIALLASVIVRLWRASWYGYEMVACGGGVLFLTFQLVLFSWLLITGRVNGFSWLVAEITDMAGYFAALSILPMTILAILVSLSNVSLVIHEGFRPVNLLGIVVSVFWAGANVFWILFDSMMYRAVESFELVRILDSLIAAAISYGECLLLSTMVCAWLASRHEPRHGVDHLIILGCGIRDDGTPMPLLEGRIERARLFDEKRVAAGDAPTCFVPSGGQGGDEPMSEAASMGRYLQGKGVEPDRIALEDRSTTTSENMAFSREVIEQHAGCDVSELRVGFSTTNYHVFRGYVCAHQAGMAVEGMGSRTRAYFWPNAFLREFAGLLVTERWAILSVFFIIAVVYGVAEYVLTFG